MTEMKVIKHEFGREDGKLTETKEISGLNNGQEIVEGSMVQKFTYPLQTAKDVVAKYRAKIDEQELSFEAKQKNIIELKKQIGPVTKGFLKAYKDAQRFGAYSQLEQFEGALKNQKEEIALIKLELDKIVKAWPELEDTKVEQLAKGNLGA